MQEMTRRVLGLAARGMSSSEIADDLGVDVDVVRGHLDEAMGALGARSRLEAVILGIRRGVIRVEGRDAIEA